MRFSVEYKLSNIKVPIDYRAGFVSLLKKIFQVSNPKLYKEFYENNENKNITKPFTFSIYFPNCNIKKEEIVTSDKLIFNFSTNSYELATYFYNGVIKIKEYPLFDNIMKFEKLHYEPEVKITENVCLFKTMSCILIESKKEDKYVTPDDKEFIEELNYHTTILLKNFMPHKINSVIEFIPIKINKTVVKHFGITVDGILGEFILKGDPECLKLIYDVGLGSRRNQGFGMLKLITQIRGDC